MRLRALRSFLVRWSLVAVALVVSYHAGRRAVEPVIVEAAPESAIVSAEDGPEVVQVDLVPGDMRGETLAAVGGGRARFGAQRYSVGETVGGITLVQFDQANGVVVGTCSAGWVWGAKIGDRLTCIAECGSDIWSAPGS